ncbi:hypothetical protein B0H11DRAFT_177293 [Mycena galericulata]|nr:hypothetical protein B0H11DRAFT_177293 [Mycena galericulata]
MVGSDKQSFYTSSLHRHLRPPPPPQLASMACDWCCGGVNDVRVLELRPRVVRDTTGLRSSDPAMAGTRPRSRSTRSSQRPHPPPNVRRATQLLSDLLSQRPYPPPEMCVVPHKSWIEFIRSVQFQSFNLHWAFHASYVRNTTQIRHLQRLHPSHKLLQLQPSTTG